METGILYIFMGVVSIASFLLGKYVYPEAQETFGNFLESYPMLLNWGIAVCKYIKQYSSADSTGAEKNAKAAEIIKEIANKAGFVVSDEEAKAVAQAAYDEWHKGVASINKEASRNGDQE